MDIEQKTTAKLWFQSLRDMIVAEFEKLEAELEISTGAPGRPQLPVMLHASVGARQPTPSTWR